MEDFNFLRNYVLNTINAEKPADIRTLVYRDGGVQLAPGNIAQAFIPERLLDHKETVEYDGKTYEVNVKGKLKDGDMVIVASFTGDTKYMVLDRYFE